MAHTMQPSQALKPSWTVSGVVEAPVEKVWPLLLDSFSSVGVDRKAVESYSGQQPYVIYIGKPGNGKITVEVDKVKHSILIQGEWWYRGVHTVTPHLRGSLITYNVYNIAPGIGWWAAQWVQGRENARGMKGQLQAGLDAIGKQLGCAVFRVST
ncbi:MAG: hypothetical protein ABI970_16500 [Chloroflexota bacterium]